MTILGRDDFTGSGQLTSHTPSGTGAVVGSSWSLAYGSAAAFVLSGGVLTFATSTFGEHMAVYNGPSGYGNDYTSSVVIHWASYGGGEHHFHLAGRAASGTSAAYRAGYDTIRQQFELYRTDATGSIAATLGTSAFARPSTGTNTLSLVTCGSRIRVLLDGAVIIDTTDTTLTTGLAAIGFHSDGSANTTFDAWTLDTVDTTAREVVFSTQPATTAGKTVALTTQPVVSIVDIGGRTVTTDTSTVTVVRNIVSGTGVLSGTTSKAAVSGATTYTDLSIDQPGTYTLTASDGTLLSATSSQFTVPVIPTKLALTQQPGNCDSGSEMVTFPIVAFQDAGGNTDTTFGGAATGSGGAKVKATLNVVTGAPVLVGQTLKKSYAGFANFRGLAVSGVGTATITFSCAGYTSVTSNTFTIGAATGSFDQTAELPRSVPDTTYPSPVVTYATVTTKAALQTAYDACRVMADSVHREIIIADSLSAFQASLGTPVLQLNERPANSLGTIIIRHATNPCAEHVRVKTTDYTTQTPLETLDNTPVIRTKVGAGSTPAARTRLVGLRVRVSPSNTYTAGVSYLIGIGDDGTSGSTQLTPATCANNITLDRVCSDGGGLIDTGGVVRALGWHGVTLALTDCTFTGNEGITGGGDTQAAFASYNGPGPFLVHNCLFDGGDEPFIFGGAGVISDAMCPRDITMTQNHSYHDFARKNVLPHDVKNSWEFKTGSRVLCEGNVIDGCWVGRQNGLGVNIKSVDQSHGNAPWMGTRDFTFRKNFLRNMGGAVVTAANPEAGDVVNIQRCSYHDNVFCNTTGSTDFNGTGYQFEILGRVADIAIDHITVLNSSDYPVPLFFENDGALGQERVSMTNSIHACTGIQQLTQAQDQSNGYAGWTVATDGAFAYNVVAGVSDGAAPVSNQFPANVAAVGWTTPGITSSYVTADPVDVLAALVLSGTSPYRAAGSFPASDGLDRGADIAAVTAAVTGVVQGTPGDIVDPTVTHLALTTQPSASTVSGVAHAVQPAGLIQDASNATVTGDTSTVTATWVSETGSGTAGGTLTKAAVAGAWAFTNLSVTSAAGCTGHWHFADGSLTGVDSSTITITAAVVGVPVIGALPSVTDQWRPPATREGLKVIVSPSTLIGTGGLVAVASNTVSVHIPVGRLRVSVLSFALDAMVAAVGSGAITVQVAKVTATGTVTALSAATSIKSDVITTSGNLALPILASAFANSSGARVIDGTRGDFLRVDIVAAGTITTQPQLRVVAELAVTG